MNPKQKETFAEKILDLAHLAAGALIFGQLLTKTPDLNLVITGFVVLGGLYTTSYLLLTNNQ